MAYDRWLNRYVCFVSCLLACMSLFYSTFSHWPAFFFPRLQRLQCSENTFASAFDTAFSAQCPILLDLVLPKSMNNFPWGTLHKMMLKYSELERPDNGPDHLLYMELKHWHANGLLLRFKHVSQKV